MNGSGGGIYADYFDDEEKENFDIDNLTFKNKGIQKLSIGNSVSHQKFGGNCGSLNDLKRDSLVYKQSSIGLAKNISTPAPFQKSFPDKMDQARGVHRRSAINYR